MVQDEKKDFANLSDSHWPKSESSFNQVTSNHSPNVNLAHCPGGPNPSGETRLLTDGITLPPAPALTIAGAVEQVALFMALVKCVIHIVSDVVHNALIYLGNSGMGGEQVLGFNDENFKKLCYSKHTVPSTTLSRPLIKKTFLAAENEHFSKFSQYYSFCIQKKSPV